MGRRCVDRSERGLREGLMGRSYPAMPRPAITAPSPGMLPRHRPTPTRSPSRAARDRKSTRLNSSHSQISYAVFCLKKKKINSTATVNAMMTLRGLFPRKRLDELCVESWRLYGHLQQRGVPSVDVSTGALRHGLAVP